jgi:hypothetical protein
MMRMVQPQGAWDLGMSDDQQKCGGRFADGDEARLALRMIGIREGHGERVAENGRGFLEGYAVLAQVGGGLGRIPGEPQPAPSATHPINPSTGDDAEA